MPVESFRMPGDRRTARNLKLVRLVVAVAVERLVAALSLRIAERKIIMSHRIWVDFGLHSLYFDIFWHHIDLRGHSDGFAAKTREQTSKRRLLFVCRRIREIPLTALNLGVIRRVRNLSSVAWSGSIVGIAPHY